MQNARPYYAAFLDLNNRLCTVIGGGTIASRKIHKLVEAGAKVRVISPVLQPDLQELACCEIIEWVQREYEQGDATAAWIVFAATNRREINHAIALEAERAGKFVNVIDLAEECSLTVPASVNQGAVQVAISTSGTNPAAARRLRMSLERDLQSQTGEFSEELRKMAAWDGGHRERRAGTQRYPE